MQWYVRYFDLFGQKDKITPMSTQFYHDAEVWTYLVYRDIMNVSSCMSTVFKWFLIRIYYYINSSTNGKSSYIPCLF